MNPLPSQINHSVVSAMRCLEAVVASDLPVSGRELARRIGVDRVRVNRMLMTLAYIGVLERTTTGRYRPGSGIHALAALASEGSSLQRIAIAHIRPWWRDGFSVTLGVLWQTYICYLIRATPNKPLEEGLGGTHGPAWQSSAGLMLLAYLPAKSAAAILSSMPATVKTENTNVRQLLSRTRKQRYARLDFDKKITSIGVPIGSPPVAALAVSRCGLSPREFVSYLQRLRLTAKAIADDLAAEC